MNPPAKPVEIIGGGLAGLSLGLNLALRNIPVTLHEASDYPRHRVCGEFIAGLAPQTIQYLNLAPFLSDAAKLSDVCWFHHQRKIRSYSLPAPAYAISRHALDARLAHAFVSAGGILHTQSRINTSETPDGRVFCTGRRRTPSRWIGIKLHATNLSPQSDLELHLGNNGYAGLSKVENGHTNICGLFRLNSNIRSNREMILYDYLVASSMTDLAHRLQKADICTESCSAIAAFTFGRKPEKMDTVQLGDTFAMTAPYTGNGMAIAFQSAAIALQPLIDWSVGLRTWNATAAAINAQLRQSFSSRLTASCALHPFLYSPGPQRLLTLTSRTALLPIHWLYNLTH